MRSGRPRPAPPQAGLRAAPPAGPGPPPPAAPGLPDGFPLGVRLSLPNDWLATTTPRNLPSQLKTLWAMSTKGPKVRRAAQARLTQLARRQAAERSELAERAAA